MKNNFIIKHQKCSQNSLEYSDFIRLLKSVYRFQFFGHKFVKATKYLLNVGGEPSSVEAGEFLHFSFHSDCNLTTTKKYSFSIAIMKSSSFLVLTNFYNIIIVVFFQIS